MRVVDMQGYISRHRVYSSMNRGNRASSKAKSYNENFGSSYTRYRMTNPDGVSGLSHDSLVETLRNKYMCRYGRSGKSSYDNINKVINHNYDHLNKMDSTNTDKTQDAKKSNTENVMSDKNTLDFTNVGKFSVKTSTGKLVSLRYKNGQVYLNDRIELLSDIDKKEINQMEKFFTYLGNDPTGEHIKESFSKDDIKKYLSNAGINAGFFNVATSKGTKRLCVLDNGSIYTNEQVEFERNFYNSTNLIKYEGYSKDAFCLIDGKRYEITPSGNFNIPEGVRCVKENMKIYK